ncbi:MAG: RidA family protein [Betaproteobacteria bacterium]|nr:RidA family protein [Betaproteobacteria bacterium]
MDILRPAGWAKPRGYSNGIVARGRHIFVAGQIGWDAQCQFTSQTLDGQTAQALRNIVAVLSEAGAKPEHITRMTWYVTSKAEYLAAAKEIGAAYREIIGRHYPVMTAVQVVALMEDMAKVEIEVTAVVQD